MTALLRSLRRRILTPSVAATSLEKRKFNRKDPAAQELLETIGRTFLEGYGHAAESRSLPELEHRLEAIDRRFCGFAYEGAAMGCTVLDALPGSGGRRLTGLLAGRGREHVYMAYVGIGWAMARLPRFRWPDISATDPLLRWLVLDGYGFHQAYFRTERYVRGQQQKENLRWPYGPQSYVTHAIDQGAGRALWFVGGTDPDAVAALVEAFPEERRADLYSGVGLAATYAGGAAEGELRALWERAGEHRPQLAQGAAFAAEARERAQLTGAHTRLATQVFCGMGPEQAAQMCTRLQPDGPDRAAGGAYAAWRRSIAAELATQQEVLNRDGQA